MPLFKRHKVLLGVILQAPKIPTLTELMKWLFLIKKETFLSSDSSFYEFIPYKYGPYSFTVDRDIDELSRFGYFTRDDFRIQSCLLSDAYRNFQSLPENVRSAIRSIFSQYGRLSLSHLIESVYERYPWFASKSKLKGKSSLPNNSPKPAAFTAGYEGASIDTFLNKLMTAGIVRIIDVRNNPVSRKYGFSKMSLSRLSNNLGIEYINLPALGIPPSNRRSLANFDDYKSLMDYYETSILPTVPEPREYAARLLQDLPSVLVCFEADPHYCHRSRLAAALSADTGLKVIHL
jgi:uncharacterized protein YwgA